MKILVIDDHALRRDALQGVMKKLKRGAVVLEASDSRQAMEILASETDLSLVLLDLDLPDFWYEIRTYLIQAEICLP
jgi:DNA-binding NarL/FixJ family response regulator